MDTFAFSHTSKIFGSERYNFTPVSKSSPVREIDLTLNKLKKLTV